MSKCFRFGLRWASLEVKQSQAKFLNENFGTKPGGASEDRTRGLLHAMQALSQLSYGPQIIFPQRNLGQYNIRPNHCQSYVFVNQPRILG